MKSRLPVLGSRAARPAPLAASVPADISRRLPAPLPLVCIESREATLAARFAGDLIAAVQNTGARGDVEVILAYAESMERELGSAGLRALGADRHIRVVDAAITEGLRGGGDRPALVVDLGAALGRKFEPWLSVEVEVGAALRAQNAPRADLCIPAVAGAFTRPIGEHLRARVLDRRAVRSATGCLPEP